LVHVYLYIYIYIYIRICFSIFKVYSGTVQRMLCITPNPVVIEDILFRCRHSDSNWYETGSILYQTHFEVRSDYRLLTRFFDNDYIKNQTEESLVF